MILKACPCGKTPSKLLLHTEEGHPKPKWARCSGDCCGLWEVEFRNNYKYLDSDESMQIAGKVWNAQPRWDDK